MSKKTVVTFIFSKRDIIDKPTSDWWTVAAVRTRGTFSTDNHPMVARANQLVNSMKRELQTQNNARVKDKKQQFRRPTSR